MGFGEIIIRKIPNNENANIGCYEISSHHFDIDNFFMCINKTTKIIKFFASNNFNENPIRVVDYNKNERLGTLPGVPTKILGIVLLRAFKTFKMDAFPESLSYAA